MSRKIDAVLDKLEKVGGLSSDGRAWLVAACDPFHDTDLVLAGYPDVTSASTVVQLVKKQFQIAVPTSGRGSVTSGANWDCSITLFPTSHYISAATTANFNPANGTLSGQSTCSVSAGGLTVSAGPQGNALWPTTALPDPLSTFSGVGCPEYCKGNARVIGMGFEVVNTTAAINRQGQVTAWRMPNIDTTIGCTLPVATTPPSAFDLNVTLQRFPPPLLADAMLLYGSRSWGAEEGAYVVSRLTSTDNGMGQPTTKGLCYSPDDIDASANTVIKLYSYGTPGSPGQAYLDAPFDISGVHFTGLSYATTLTVNVRWLIERMPGPKETDLVVLATPSPTYDPLAFDLYTRCMRDMPPGVMLKENPLGEWFKSALSSAADFLPVIGNALNNALPGAGAVGGALGQLARGISQAIPGKAPPQAQTLPGSASGGASGGSAAPTSSGLKRLGLKKRKKVAVRAKKSS